MLTVYDGNIWCAEPKDTIAAIGRKLKTIFLSEGPAKIAFFRRFILIFAFDGHLDHTNFIEKYSKAYNTMLCLIHLQMTMMYNHDVKLLISYLNLGSYELQSGSFVAG